MFKNIVVPANGRAVIFVFKQLPALRLPAQSMPVLSLSKVPKGPKRAWLGE
jgi:hypothetical protein